MLPQDIHAQRREPPSAPPQGVLRPSSHVSPSPRHDPRPSLFPNRKQTREPNIISVSLSLVLSGAWSPPSPLFPFFARSQRLLGHLTASLSHKKTSRAPVLVRRDTCARAHSTSSLGGYLGTVLHTLIMYTNQQKNGACRGKTCKAPFQKKFPERGEFARKRRKRPSRRRDGGLVNFMHPSPLPM